MFASTKGTLVVLLLSTGLVGAGLTRHEWGRRSGPEDMGGPATWEVVAPSDGVKISQWRIKAKLHVIRQLAGGELTLFTAAVLFRELNDTPEDAPERSWKLLPGDCDNEKLCRQVIAWSQTHFKYLLPPSQVELALRALEDDLTTHLAQHGTVILPTQVLSEAVSR